MMTSNLSNNHQLLGVSQTKSANSDRAKLNATWTQNIESKDYLAWVTYLSVAFNYENANAFDCEIEYDFDKY